MRHYWEINCETAECDHQDDKDCSQSRPAFNQALKEQFDKQLFLEMAKSQVNTSSSSPADELQTKSDIIPMSLNSISLIKTPRIHSQIISVSPLDLSQPKKRDESSSISSNSAGVDDDWVRDKDDVIEEEQINEDHPNKSTDK